MTFQVPTIKERGQIARTIAAVHAQKPDQGEKTGLLRCVCGSMLRFTVNANGASRATCVSACGVRWI